MRVLIACEFSGIVRDAFAAKGHDAWSCDLRPSERNGKHIQDDVLNHLKDGWDMMIGHPSCTLLAASGNRWLYEPCSKGSPEQRKIDREKAIEFFLTLLNCGIPKVAIENPCPHPYVLAKIGAFQQKIQPWEFGDKAKKTTCLWLRNLPPLMATIIEDVKNRKALCHYESPGENREKNRSRTYPGIANAMAQQWG